MLSKAIPGSLFDMQGAGEAFGEIKQIGLCGEKQLGEAKARSSNSGQLRLPQVQATGLGTADGEAE